MSVGADELCAPLVLTYARRYGAHSSYNVDGVPRRPGAAIYAIVASVRVRHSNTRTPECTRYANVKRLVPFTRRTNVIPRIVFGDSCAIGVIAHHIAYNSALTMCIQ